MRLIGTIRELEALAKRLSGETLVAADTEAAGYHRYLDTLCLVQLSTRDETWLVDTVALGSLNPLADVFEDPGVEIVFHDADYDLRLLDRDFGIHVAGLFDTKIAARFLGERSFGLAKLLEDELGVALEKKYQRADWARRPLPDEMLEYAAMDTRYLPQLRDALRARLIEMRRLEWAEEEFGITEKTRWEPPDDAGTTFLRLKGTRDLDRRGLAVLRELYRWREAVAEERDVASFRVLNNEALVDVAREMPRTGKELANVPRLSTSNARRYGEAMMTAVDRARAMPEGDLPERPRPPRRPARDPEFDRQVDRLKDVRDREAERLGLERGFLMPRSQLESLARERPTSLNALARVDTIRRWQVEALGGALLEGLHENGTNEN